MVTDVLTLCCSVVWLAAFGLGLGFGLGLEPTTVCGWVSVSVGNVTRTHAIGVSWWLGNARVRRYLLSPHGTPIACVLVTFLTLALTKPPTVLGSNPNPNPNPKARIGGVCINHRPSRRTHDLHQAYDTPQGFD